MKYRQCWGHGDPADVRVGIDTLVAQQPHEVGDLGRVPSAPGPPAQPDPVVVRIPGRRIRQTYRPGGQEYAQPQTCRADLAHGHPLGLDSQVFPETLGRQCEGVDQDFGLLEGTMQQRPDRREAGTPGAGASAAPAGRCPRSRRTPRTTPVAWAAADRPGTSRPPTAPAGRTPPPRQHAFRLPHAPKQPCTESNRAPAERQGRGTAGGAAPAPGKAAARRVCLTCAQQGPPGGNTRRLCCLGRLLPPHCVEACAPLLFDFARVCLVLITQSVWRPECGVIGSVQRLRDPVGVDGGGPSSRRPRPSPWPRA